MEQKQEEKNLDMVYRQGQELQIMESQHQPNIKEPRTNQTINIKEGVKQRITNEIKQK